MIYHQINRNERLDQSGVFTHSLDRRAHRREIYKQRNTRKILQNYAGDDERDLLRAFVRWSPRRKLTDMRFADFFSAVEVTQNGFENDADRDRQPRNIAETGVFKLRQRIKYSVGSVSSGKCLSRVK